LFPVFLTRLLTDSWFLIAGMILLPCLGESLGPNDIPTPLSWRIFERTGGQRCNHLPTSISRRAYKPCGWWGDEIACWEFVIWSLWCLTSIILWRPSQTSNHVLNGLPRYAVIIFTGFPFPRTISIIWWLLFTLFDPGTIVLWVWTYQHWKFWFNEVCFQAKKIFFFLIRTLMLMIGWKPD
jgi:hypothetical protein